MRSRLIRATALATLAGCVGTAAPAGGEGGPVPAAVPGIVEARREPVDESALRYWAATRDAVRVEAESRRLRRLHPDWTPPDDLDASQLGSEEEGPIWDHLAAERPDLARREIGARQIAEPGWTPSAGLVRQLARKEFRVVALAHARAERWFELVGLAADWRRDADAGDVELAWAMAEAHARADRAVESAAILEGILDRPRTTPAERAATIHKALALLPMATADRLIATERDGEFAPIRVDITRARMGAILRGEPGAPVTGAQIAEFQDYARRSEDPNGAGLLAWLAFKRRDHDEALAWFKLAISRGGDAMVAHGLAHTLRRLGRTRDAEEVAYAWREPLVNNVLLYLDILETELTRERPPAIEADRIARYAALTLAVGSGEGAQALGWYAYNLCQFDTALDWFRRAVAWFPKEATVYGYALTLQRLKRQRDFIEVVNRYDGLFPKVVGILFDVRDASPTPCGPAEPPPVRTASTAGRYLDLVGPGGGASAGKAVPPPRVPRPGDGEPGGPGAGRLPAVLRSDFPISVAPENDLRFPSVRIAAPSAGAAVVRWRERGQSAAPNVARRVPGVGALPYERFGFALLPAADGTTGPSVPAAAERPAPLGTLWSDEQSGLAPVPGRGAALPFPKTDPRSRT